MQPFLKKGIDILTELGLMEMRMCVEELLNIALKKESKEKICSSLLK